MPEHFCTLALSPLFKAIVSDLHGRAVMVPETEEDLRLAEVLIDQCRLAPRDQSYLPFAEDPLLSPILSCLCGSPGDGCSLAGWAERLHTTERTLSRRWRSVVGLSSQEWRQRCKRLSALTRLEAGQPVQTVAYDLGFRSPSAFIEMFRQTTGTTPGSVVSRAHPEQRAPSPAAQTAIRRNRMPKTNRPDYRVDHLSAPYRLHGAVSGHAGIAQQVPKDPSRERPAPGSRFIIPGALTICSPEHTR